MEQSGELKKRRVIAVISPKGGVGRSAVSCLLALAFHKRGRKVLLMDLHPTIPTQDLYFGLEDGVLFGFSDLFAGKDALQVLTAATADGRLMLCPCGATALPSKEEILQEIERLALLTDAEIVILDLPSDAPYTLYCAGKAEIALIVSTADPTALVGAQNASEQLAVQDTTEGCPRDGKIFLLLNRFPLEQAGQPHMRPHRMIDEVARPLIGILPEDGELASFLNRGEATNLSEDALCPILNVAARLEGEQRLLFEGMKEGKRFRRAL